MNRPTALILLLASLATGITLSVDRDVAHAAIDPTDQAVSALRTLCVVNEQFRSRFGHYADSVAELRSTGYLEDRPLPSHRIDYRRDGSGFSANAVALDPSNTPSFRVDDAGRISIRPGPSRQHD